MSKKPKPTPRWNGECRVRRIETFGGKIIFRAQVFRSYGYGSADWFDIQENGEYATQKEAEDICQAYFDTLIKSDTVVVE